MKCEECSSTSRAQVQETLRTPATSHIRSLIKDCSCKHQHLASIIQCIIDGELSGLWSVGTDSVMSRWLNGQESASALAGNRQLPIADTKQFA